MAQNSENKNKKSCTLERRISYYPRLSIKSQIESLASKGESKSSIVDALCYEALQARKAREHKG